MCHSILVFVTIDFVSRTNLHIGRLANDTGDTGRLEISQYGLYMVVLYPQTSRHFGHFHIPRIQCLVLHGRAVPVETEQQSSGDCYYYRYYYYYSQTNTNDILIIIIIIHSIIYSRSRRRNTKPGQSNAIVTRLLGIGRRNYVDNIPYRTGVW